MIDLKKKCWREKITAEITVAHVQHFAKELGITMSAADAAMFLNQKGRAQAVWMYMMQAGEEFLKANFAGRTGVHTARRSTSTAAAPTHPIHTKQSGAATSARISYQ
jgi:hypothetical protein